MTHEADDEQQTSSTQQQQEGAEPSPPPSSGNRIVFTLQGGIPPGTHFHHVHRPNEPSASRDERVRFKDKRAREQVEKLREKIRERQLGGAAGENVPDTVLVPCQGHCRHTAPVEGEVSSSSSDDAADEVLQRLLSNITSLHAGSVTATSAVVTWDELDIQSCLYDLTLIAGKTETVFENIETPHCLDDLSPGVHYGVSVRAIVSSIRGDASAPYYFETHSTEPSQPPPPRPGGATKTSLQIKWNAVNANGSPINHYTLFWDQGTGDWLELSKSPDRQFKATGLSPGTDYSFKVSAVNDIGESLQSNVGICTTGVGTPTPPTCIYLGQASERTLKICWSPPSDDGGAEVDGYTVEQETEYGFISVYDGELQECTITDLARSTHYMFRVYSRNVAGQSKPSVVVTFTTRAGLPPSPRSVRVDGKEKSDCVVIAWDAPVLEGDQEILRYNLKVTPMREDVTPALLELHTTDDTKCKVGGLLPGSSYRVLVTMVTAGGEGPSSPPFVFRTRPVMPSAPNPPMLRTKQGSYNLSLQWSSPSYNGGSSITKYTLEMYREDWIQLYSGIDTVYLVPGLVPGKSYTFRLRCHNAVGVSLYSNTVNYFTAPAPPSPPSAPSFTSKGPFAANITWEESATNGCPVTFYTLEMCLTDDKFKEVYNGKPPNCIIRELQAGCTYYCTVKANSEAGLSCPSDVTTYYSPSAPPAAVSGIFLVDSSDSSFTVGWSEPSSVGSELGHYNVCFNGVISHCEEPTFTATGLQSETNYKVRVQAVNTVGAGPFSPVHTVATCTPLPQSLNGHITLMTLGHNFLKVSWNSVRSVKMYEVERRASNEEEFLSVYSGNKNQVKIGKLLPCTSYDVRVCGVNSAGLGPWLNASFVTESVPPPPIIKVTSSIAGTHVTIKWAIKDKLREKDVFQAFQGADSGAFQQVYEGTDVSYTTHLEHGTVSYFKVRAKREGISADEYGPYSQTVVVKLKAAPKKKVESVPEKKGSETDLNCGLNDHQITIFIFLALCLPALLAIVYFMNF